MGARSSCAAGRLTERRPENNLWPSPYGPSAALAGGALHNRIIALKHAAALFFCGETGGACGLIWPPLWGWTGAMVAQVIGYMQAGLHFVSAIPPFQDSR